VVCTSGIVRLECLAGAFKTHDSALADRYRMFLHATEQLELDESAIERAAQLWAQYGLLLPDALHLAIAERHACEEFWTADGHFRHISTLQGLQVRMIV